LAELEVLKYQPNFPYWVEGTTPYLSNCSSLAQTGGCA